MLTSPIFPCQAAPALETTKSTPPHFATTLPRQDSTVAGWVTSHVNPNPPISFATRWAAAPSRSKTDTSAPAFAKNLAVASPIPLPPPVTTTICPPRAGPGPLKTFACSSDQYSTAKISCSGMGRNCPTLSAFCNTPTEFSYTSALTFASVAVLPTPNKPNPGTKTTLGTTSSITFFSSHFFALRRK